MSEWISVADSLPDSGEPVLVCRDSIHEPFIGNVVWETPAYEETFKAFWYWDGVHNEGENWDDVTHWMPLPERPKEVE